MSEGEDGRPFPDGDDHGDADDEFASVVFDEAFVRAAPAHEPTARERRLAAAQARAEADAARARSVGGGDDDEPPRFDDGFGFDGYHRRDVSDEDELGLWAGPYRHRGHYGAHTRWHRTIAWVLALVMGVGVVALSFAAVYRGAGGVGRQPAPPPASGPSTVPRPAVKAPSSATP
ncbi:MULTISPECIES: SCO2584 family spore wall biosynthesis protein [Streptomycetaceae]|uniref:Membrane protein n=1 Tax=Streptantibioticus cattleyicolor (strain ATCC 35852 / DSM 46488 / JCM 4925 / NBRC 14057 / NRRL 8057) TaxID=1003195 RepID=F8JPU6_STREN